MRREQRGVKAVEFERLPSRIVTTFSPPFLYRIKHRGFLRRSVEPSNRRTVEPNRDDTARHWNQDQQPTEATILRGDQTLEPLPVARPVTLPKERNGRKPRDTGKLRCDAGCSMSFCYKRLRCVGLVLTLFSTLCIITRIRRRRSRPKWAKEERGDQKKNKRKKMEETAETDRFLDISYVILFGAWGKWAKGQHRVDGSQDSERRRTGIVSFFLALHIWCGVYWI